MAVSTKYVPKFIVLSMLLILMDIPIPLPTLLLIFHFYLGCEIMSFFSSILVFIKELISRESLTHFAIPMLSSIIPKGGILMVSLYR